jgi:Insecticidal Crystal Toxin, P42
MAEPRKNVNAISVGEEVLHGKYAARPMLQEVGISLKNETEIPLVCAAAENAGVLRRIYSVEPNSTIPSLIWRYDSIILLSGFSGAFVGVLDVSELHNGDEIKIQCDILRQPNKIGRPPEPTADMLIPGDSPRVMVGCGKTQTNPAHYMTREQYWKLQPESYCLAPHESKTVSQTVTSGMQDTTSQQETLAASLGVSASAGWGPISASVSASLSATSSSFQQITVSTETTAFEQVVLENESEKTQLYLRWQLIDTVNIFGAESLLTHSEATLGGAPARHSNLLGTIVTAVKPLIVMGPYDTTA